MPNEIYPLLFEPVYKDYPWGGTRIPGTFNRKLPSGIYAESWEIADREDGMSIISNGPLKGKSLREAVEAQPLELLGTRTEGSRFPLLIKLIDAEQRLSVQVHPDNKAAEKFGGEPKTEMWYVLGSEPSQVFCGLRPGVSRQDFIQAVQNGTSEATLQPIPVEKDSAIFVRGGQVHAIDAGCLILEIQQNSNTTYRIYDWGRTGNDGKPRELHVEQALNVIDWDDDSNPHIKPEPTVEAGAVEFREILSCEYFRLERIRINAALSVPMDGTTFHALFVSEGEAVLEWEDQRIPLSAGTSALIPAALPTYTLSGNAVVLRTTIP